MPPLPPHLHTPQHGRSGRGADNCGWCFQPHDKGYLPLALPHEGAQYVCSVQSCRRRAPSRQPAMATSCSQTPVRHRPSTSPAAHSHSPPCDPPDSALITGRRGPGMRPHLAAPSSSPAAPLAVLGSRPRAFAQTRALPAASASARPRAWRALPSSPCPHALGRRRRCRAAHAIAWRHVPP